MLTVCCSDPLHHDGSDKVGQRSWSTCTLYFVSAPDRTGGKVVLKDKSPQRKISELMFFGNNVTLGPEPVRVCGCPTVDPEKSGKVMVDK